MLTVCCLKQGTLYGADYVNKLAAMVARNLTLPHKFVCFTDDNRGLPSDLLTWPIPPKLEGWWGKLWLFRTALLRERILFFDLDTVILGSLDAIASYNGPFAILRDFNFADQYGSGVMAWRPSSETDWIWQNWDEAGRPRPEGGDQVVIEKSLRAMGVVPDLWQDLFPGAFVSYKLDCFYVPPRPEAKVVCFHGTPKPHECKRKFITDAWRVEKVGHDAINKSAGALSPQLAT